MIFAPRAYLKTAVIAFITNVNKNVWPNIRITYNTFSIVFLTESTNCNARLLSAKNKIRMMLRHFYYKVSIIKIESLAHNNKLSFLFKYISNEYFDGNGKSNGNAAI